MSGYSGDFMKEACNVIERAMQEAFKEKIRVIAIDEEIKFIDQDELLKLLLKPEIPESMLIKCPFCESKFLKVDALLNHLDKDHKDKKHS